MKVVLEMASGSAATHKEFAGRKPFACVESVPVVLVLSSSLTVGSKSHWHRQKYRYLLGPSLRLVVKYASTVICTLVTREA